MMRLLNSIVVFSLFLLITACAEEPNQKTIRLGINPWPGYEFLYLAAQKDFFKEEGLDIELVELASLADIKRVFEQGRIDAMASTIIEAVEVSLNSDTKIDIVLVPDFSNGGDVIIATKPLTNIADLQGKKIGVELGLLGSFILAQALDKNGLSLDDVTMMNVEQLNAKQQLLLNSIDAVVTYPPFATQILRHGSVDQIFSTTDIPGDVIDVVSVRDGVLLNPQQWQQKLFTAWQRALDFAKSNSDEAYKIMADREGISVEEFEAALTGVSIIEKDFQLMTLHSEQLANNIEKVCQTLNQIETHQNDCETISSRIGPLYND
jgi:NitT/TauT family transport system substrate-binding protein